VVVWAPTFVASAKGRHPEQCYVVVGA
jgi:hypothetical protein